jgi:hypothetical protein
VTALDWQADWAFWDPSRRRSSNSGTGGTQQRVSRHGDLYEPPLSFINVIRARVRCGGVAKLSPALPDDTLASLDGRVEFLSEYGECKEACVWFGDARGAAGDHPRATVLLPDRFVVAPVESGNAFAPVGLPGVFVHDPDAALVRCGPATLAKAAYHLHAHLLSLDDVYLTGDVPAGPARLARSYRVRDVLPYKPRVLRDLLRAQNVTRLVVKKRYFPYEPDVVARDLGLPPRGSSTGNEATLILVRTGKTHLAVLCDPVTTEAMEQR